ncbi:hypothetical protein SEPCBS119000_005411 [Sporothrix epigloea]|uniref:Uncharacterized protein n=1 Tax=Sporothrix epigloea TaxID=1892477 RepID=A0ABP0DZE7_9PEZI
MNEIPVLKTTMIVESHWRSLKHDYLHRFNRPRIDLVTWVLTMDVFPAATTRMDAILRRDSRTGRASWRKPFKSEWKKLPALDDNDSIASHYHTDYKKFEGSSSGGDDDDSSDEGSHSDSDSDSDSDSGSDSDSDSDSDSEGECDTGIEADPDEEIDFDAEGVFDDESGLAEKTGLSSQVIGDRRSEVGFSSNTDDASEALGPVIAKDPRPKLRRLLSMLDEQFMSAGNVELLEAVDDHLDLSFMDEIDRTKRQRTMPKTWDPKRSRIALYYRPLSL